MNDQEYLNYLRTEPPVVEERTPPGCFCPACASGGVMVQRTTWRGWVTETRTCCVCRHRWTKEPTRLRDVA